MNKTILIADDDHNVLAGLEFLLTEEGYDIVQANSPGEVVSIINRQTIDLLLTDMNFKQDTTSGQEGITLLSTLNQSDPDLPVIVMTGWATIDVAVEALKAGANDFVQKPWNDERLLSLIQTQLKLSMVQKKASRLQQQNKLLNGAKHPTKMEEIIAISCVMKELLETLSELAKSDMNILLTGDNGTGKSMLAQFVHHASERSHQPFVSVNMGAISENLFESEMFGHNKGAFTDAKENRIGRFELAEEGTLFLDELANIPFNQQAKLLRVLEERKFERVGSSKTVDADVRIISATNADLGEVIEQAKFRQDLYFRLNTIEIRVPSLNERTNDIPALADYFLDKYSQKYNKPKPELSSSALKLLLTYSWPGNIRELSHLMERVLFVCKDGSIEASHLNLNVGLSRAVSSVDNGRATIDEIEQSVLVSRLEFYQGNVTQTAKSLGLSRSGYYRRIQKYGLE
ncbi:MAG: sigma-54 dependent transcriptional regulator [Kangiellaceae bacterium]|nr:sigma-54 dependent transcriptional regulator [Kangiellaceae bacterium]